MYRQLGQSSVEYLTTYGWMFVAVSVAGATLYPALNLGCEVQIQEDIRTGGLAVEQAGITENGSFEVVLDSDTREEILIESLELQKGEESLKVVQPQSVSPGGEIVFPIGQVEKTGSCQEYNVNVQFDKGPLKDQRMQLRIKGSMNLVESFASLLEITGDNIPSIEILSSVRPTNETMCIGTECNETTGTPVQSNEYVNYSGDEMTGTLRVRDIKANCYGANCPIEQGIQTGYLTTEEGQMNGTLNVTEIMPLTEDDPRIDFR